MEYIRPGLRIRYGLGNVKDDDKRGFLRGLYYRLRDTFRDRFITLAVFGSVGRGDDDKYSDLDILIIIDFDDISYARERVIEIIHSLKIENQYLFDIDLYLLDTRGAKRFRMIYLDMTSDTIIIHDRDNTFRGILSRVVEKLRELGSIKIVEGDSWYWILKPDIRPGEEVSFDIK